MKYYEVKFAVSPMSEDACDVLSAFLAEVGFETFETTNNGIIGYVQQALWDQTSVDASISAFPMDVQISYTIEEAPDENWNQAWEEEGFEPITIGDIVCVHDTKHEGDSTCKYDIVINPKMAFGSGTHPTTQMILHKLTEIDLTGKDVVDAGCGTGVLGILAMKCGANSILAYDIDEWSVENTKENFPLNGISTIDVRHGDSSVLKDVREKDILIANINRNILLGDMERFTKTLKKNGLLILSGFYETDVPYLANEASKYGLAVKEKEVTKDWCLLVLG